MQDSPDIGKIISLVMENPDLIAKVSELMKGGTQNALPEKEAEPTVTAEAPSPPSVRPRRAERGQLLSAMKPYLRESRARAIDTMVAILEVLDATGGR